jgi:hypothetical protein
MAAGRVFNSVGALAPESVFKARSIEAKRSPPWRIDGGDPTSGAAGFAFSSVAPRLNSG